MGRHVGDGVDGGPGVAVAVGVDGGPAEVVALEGLGVGEGGDGGADGLEVGGVGGVGGDGDGARVLGVVVLPTEEAVAAIGVGGDGDGAAGGA